jgi:NAD(P)-dependent dehydrogenase (short-subunit alcohol dehydrogenase family)
VIADILDEQGEKLAAELEGAAVYQHTNVSKEEDIKAAIDRAVSRFGRLDCLFNNAGFGGVSGMIEETDTTQLDTTMAVLFRAVVLGIKHAAPLMKHQGSGSIISTASVAGLRAGFGPHIYSAAKAAVIHLTKSVAMELGESGVRVNCICPGGIVTPIFGRHLGLSEEAIAEKMPLLNQAFAMVQPIRRAGQPEDIARAALWLASDAASFVSGHALVVDGALSGGRGWSEAQAGIEMMRAALTSKSS